jgi:alkylated DNA repair dioxygenase AlkB
MQTDLFGAPKTRLPDGFTYFPEALPRALQDTLLTEISALPFKNFDFHGFEGKRRVVSFGWKYDFETKQARQIGEIPPMLLPARDVAARLAGLEPNELKQALVTEYRPGAPIGWHRDKMTFDVVVGISLLSACTFRLRRKVHDKWKRVSIIAEPGSVYVLSGQARNEWEHSIPPVEQLRYSITFRQMRSRQRLLG